MSLIIPKGGRDTPPAGFALLDVSNIISSDSQTAWDSANYAIPAGTNRMVVAVVTTSAGDTSPTITATMGDETGTFALQTSTGTFTSQMHVFFWNETQISAAGSNPLMDFDSSPYTGYRSVTMLTFREAQQFGFGSTNTATKANNAVVSVQAFFELETSFAIAGACKRFSADAYTCDRGEEVYEHLTHYPPANVIVVDDQKASGSHTYTFTSGTTAGHNNAFVVEVGALS